jgi:HK97 gp10 family phage protein
MAGPVLTFRIEGLSELQATLADLPKATQRNVVKRVLAKRAEPVAAAARALAPYDEKAGGRHLRDSITVSDKLTPRQASLNRNYFKQGAVEMYIGAGPLRQATFMEFGTFKDPQQPFLRPAWDALGKAVLEGIKDDLWAEISKAAGRRARKLAKAG